MTRHLFVSVALVAAVALVLETRAQALEVPPVKDHVADPGHLLSKHDLQEVSDKLTKVEKDTAIDTAVLFVEESQDELRPLGHEAFTKWKLGHGFDNALLFVVPLHGHAYLIQNHSSPEFNKVEATQIMNTESLSASVSDRSMKMIEAAEKRLHKKALRRRPRGSPHTTRALLYLSGALAVLLFAIVRTLNARDRPSTAQV